VTSNPGRFKKRNFSTGKLGKLGKQLDHQASLAARLSPPGEHLNAAEDDCEAILPAVHAADKSKTGGLISAPPQPTAAADEGPDKDCHSGIICHQLQHQELEAPPAAALSLLGPLPNSPTKAAAKVRTHSTPPHVLPPLMLTAAAASDDAPTLTLDAIRHKHQTLSAPQTTVAFPQSSRLPPGKYCGTDSLKREH